MRCIGKSRGAVFTAPLVYGPGLLKVPLPTKFAGGEALDVRALCARVWALETLCQSDLSTVATSSSGDECRRRHVVRDYPKNHD